MHQDARDRIELPPGTLHLLASWRSRRGRVSQASARARSRRAEGSEA